MSRGDVERRTFEEERVAQAKILRCKPDRLFRKFHIFPLSGTMKKTKITL